MGRNKKLTIVIIIIVVLLLTLRIILKKTTIVGQFQKAIQKVKKKYGTAIAQNVERIYRLETANFTSAQFHKTYSPGMMAFGSSYPWGWVTLSKSIWAVNPSIRPTGVAKFEENPGLYGTGGGMQPFLKFPTLEAAVMTLAGFLDMYNNNPGRWFSLDESQQDDYNDKIEKIQTVFT